MLIPPFRGLIDCSANLSTAQVQRDEYIIRSENFQREGEFNRIQVFETAEQSRLHVSAEILFDGRARLSLSDVARHSEKTQAACTRQHTPLLECVARRSRPYRPRKYRSIGRNVQLEHLTRYKNSTERGAVIATCHSDNWELMGGAFAQNGIPLVGVAKKQRSEGADKFINEFRTLIGMHITYRSGVREMYKMLDEGHFIGLIMDQDVGRDDGVVVKFFDQATNFVTGAASMSRFRKVPIFPAFMHRNSDGTHTLEVFAPLQVEKTSDKHADLKQMTQRLATLIEEHVRKYPAEWFWLHDRWKSMHVEFEPQEVARFNEELGIGNDK